MFSNTNYFELILNDDDTLELKHKGIVSTAEWIHTVCLGLQTIYVGITSRDLDTRVKELKKELNITTSSQVYEVVSVNDQEQATLYKKDLIALLITAMSRKDIKIEDIAKTIDNNDFGNGRGLLPDKDIYRVFMLYRF